MDESRQHNAFMRRVPWFFLLALLMQLQTASADPEETYNFEETPWKESVLVLPAYPQASNLMEFYVGPTEHNRFLVDGSSITVGEDGVIRYVVVIKTSGGASNVGFEGIRCTTKEFKVYALGGPEGQWTKVAAPKWQVIENKLINQYRAVLNRDIFCPAGKAIGSAAEGRNALQRSNRP